MIREMASDKQQELVGELRRRFPLFERLIGRFGKDTQKERIPWFLALLLSAATKRDPGACCFVLDKTRGTTAVAAVLLALVRLQAEFPELVRNYAQTVLYRGQRVRVKPSDYVYEYSGLWEGYPEFFRLKVLEEEAYRSFPMADVLRLEPTDRVRPKGDLGSRLGEFERSALDEMLDLTTCGNNSLIRNTVLLYMAQAQFAEVVDTIALAPEHANGFDSLSGFLPWGSIGQCGELKPNDAYQVAGEPIVAVTRVPEDLALAALSAPVATKIVLVDGANGLARDLQAFDDVAGRQRVMILASSEETEALDLLRDRDCPIWHMSPDEILIGEASVGNRARGSLVGATIRAADTRQRVKVTVVDCRDSELQTMAASLERAAAMIVDGEEAQESEEILARLFGILLESSECCFGIGEETKANLQRARDQVIRHGRWLDSKVASELQEAICRFENVIASGIYAQGKADALLNLVLDENHEPWVVAARSPRTAESLRAGFDDLGINVPVLPVSSFTPGNDYAGIIVPAWPNEQRFTRLKSQGVTPDIRVLAYPFETKWVSRHEARERARERSNELEIETRSEILGIEPRYLTSLKRHIPDPPGNEGGPDLPIFKIEDRVRKRRIKRPASAVEGEDSREAQLVQFFGDCHALLTEWPARATLTIVDAEGAVVQARFRRLNEEILSKHALTLADVTNRAIGARMDEACGKQAAAYTLAGGSTLYDTLRSNAPAIEGGTLTLDDVLAGSSFRLPLAAAANDGMAPGAGGPVVWGRGERQVLESTESAFAWDGTVLTGQLGIDACSREDVLVGLALSRSIGEFDYSDGTGPAPVRGDYESRMTSVHPYLGWTSPQGLGLWATVGYGWGDIEIEDAQVRDGDPDYAVRRSNMTLKTAAAGASGPLMTDESPIAGGTMALELRSEASWAQVEVEGEGDDGLIVQQTVNANRLRLALEGSHEQALASGGSLTPSLELGLRHDGGDGITGTGIEIGGSLRYRDPAAGLTVEGHGRVLTGQSDYREWGLGGSVRLDPGAEGRGLSFSLFPTWGETASGVDRLWDQDVAELASDDTAANDNVPQMRLDSELGYGFGALGGHGLLTPYGGFSLAGEGSQRYRIGGRFEIGSSLNLSLEGERLEPAKDAAAEHGVMLRLQASW